MPTAAAGSRRTCAQRKKPEWCVYMLRCADRSLYTGITNNLARRLETHRSGRGSKYVYPRQPFRVVYREARASVSAALRREAQIKRLSRQQKKALIAGRPARG